MGRALVSSRIIANKTPNQMAIYKTALFESLHMKSVLVASQGNLLEYI